MSAEEANELSSRRHKEAAKMLLHDILGVPDGYEDPRINALVDYIISAAVMAAHGE